MPDKYYSKEALLKRVIGKFQLKVESPLKQRLREVAKRRRIGR